MVENWVSDLETVTSVAASQLDYKVETCRSLQSHCERLKNVCTTYVASRVVFRWALAANSTVVVALRCANNTSRTFVPSMRPPVDSDYPSGTLEEPTDSKGSE